MSYIEPSVVVNQITESQSVVPVDAELPLCIIGPLYEVVEKSAPDESFDSLSASEQDFTWPDKRVGCPVDLQGTRQGLIDSQRRDLAPFVPVIQLKDSVTSAIFDVADENIVNLSQSGFSIKAAALTSLKRATKTLWALNINNAVSFYSPDGGLSSELKSTDVFTWSSVDHTITSVSAQSLAVTPAPLIGTASSSTFISQDGTQTVGVTPAATANRVVVTITNSTFAALVAGIAAGDPIVTYIPKSGFVAVAGAVLDTAGDLSRVDGLAPGLAFLEASLIGLRAKVVNTTDGNTYWTRVIAWNESTGVIQFADDVGTTDNDVVGVTLYRAQSGVLESLSADSLQATVIVPEVFAATGTAIDVYGAGVSTDFYPQYECLATYRQMRKDIANIPLAAFSEGDFLSVVGHTSINAKDELGMAVRVALSAQGGSGTIVTFIPVDLEPDTETGLPENFDTSAAYANALEASEAIASYVFVTADQSAAVRSLVQTMVAALAVKERSQFRRAFFRDQVPLGAVVSPSGIIAPGQVSSGIASSATDGNKSLQDEGVNFVTDAGVVAGTKVVVTYPPSLAGTYVALGSTTDDVLVLDGDPWSFDQDAIVNGPSLSIVTTGGIHAFTGAPSGTYAHIEAGDYFHGTIGGQVYRLKVVSVLANGTGFSAVDEVAGDLDLTAASVTGSTFMIRSWGAEDNGPNVQYHIRPLTRQEQVTQLLAAKTVANRRFSLTLDQKPRLVTGTDESGQEIIEELDEFYTLVAAAAKRSGNPSHIDPTNLTLGGGIISVKWGAGHFNKAQLNALAEGGFCLFTQQTAGSEPLVRDYVTSETGSLEVSQEVVTSNVDWQSYTLIATYRAPAGGGTRNQNKRLSGLRAIALASILESWKQNSPEPRIFSYEITRAEQDPNNKTYTQLAYRCGVPVGEKVIQIDIYVST